MRLEQDKRGKRKKPEKNTNIHIYSLIHLRLIFLQFSRLFYALPPPSLTLCPSRPADLWSAHNADLIFITTIATTQCAMATFLIPPRQQNFYICEINFAYLVNFLFFFLFLAASVVIFISSLGFGWKTEFLFAAYKFLWLIRCDCHCWKVARKSERTLIERTRLECGVQLGRGGGWGSG